MAHNCPAPGCIVTVNDTMLMCRQHWFMVPRDLRARLWATWNRGKGWGSKEHVTAMRACVHAVRKRLSDQSSVSPEIS